MAWNLWYWNNYLNEPNFQIFWIFFLKNVRFRTKTSNLHRFIQKIANFHDFLPKAIKFLHKNWSKPIKHIILCILVIHLWHLGQILLFCYWYSKFKFILVKTRFWTSFLRKSLQIFFWVSPIFYFCVISLDINTFSKVNFSFLNI